MRAQLILLLMLFLVSGCAQARLEGSVALGAAKPEESVSAIVILPDSGKRLRAELVALGRSGVFLQNAETQGNSTWRAADGSALVTRGGLVTTTFGLGYDLIAADVSETLALVGARRQGSTVRVHQYLDGENQMITRAFHCDVSLRKTDLIGYQIREDCRGADVTFVNTFSLNQDAELVSSLQWVGPEVGYLRLETLPIESSIVAISN